MKKILFLATLAILSVVLISGCIQEKSNQHEEEASVAISLDDFRHLCESTGGVFYYPITTGPTSEYSLCDCIGDYSESVYYIDVELVGWNGCR